jgi:predicted permease
MPLRVFLTILCVTALGLHSINPALQMAALLMAAMPMMGICSTLAQKYRQENFSAVAQLLTTATSFFTLSWLLWLFKKSPIFNG